SSTWSVFTLARGKGDSCSSVQASPVPINALHPFPCSQKTHIDLYSELAQTNGNSAKIT
ncbi:hypothetical protein HGM15179_002474, partial [Zosterops borbonicus]